MPPPAMSRLSSSKLHTTLDVSSLRSAVSTKPSLYKTRGGSISSETVMGRVLCAFSKLITKCRTAEYVFATQAAIEARAQRIIPTCRRLSGTLWRSGGASVRPSLTGCSQGLLGVVGQRLGHLSKASH